MTHYISRRLLILPVVLLGVSMLVFMVIHLVPGNPAQVIAGADAPPETVAAIEKDLGLDRPLPEQYWRYLTRVVQGDLGTSLRSNRPVLDEVMDALPKTIQLAVAAAIAHTAHRDTAWGHGRRKTGNTGRHRPDDGLHARHHRPGVRGRLGTDVDFWL